MYVWYANAYILLLTLHNLGDNRMSVSEIHPGGIKKYVALYPLDIVKERELYKQIVLNIISTFAPIAADKAGLTLEDMTATLVRPTDLGLSSPQWAFSLSNTGTTANTILDNFNIARNQYLVLFGLFDSTPSMLADEIKIKLNTMPIYDVNLDILSALPSTARFGTFEETIPVGPNTNLTIELYGHGTGEEYLGLAGILFTNKGTIIA